MQRMTSLQRSLQRDVSDRYWDRSAIAISESLQRSLCKESQEVEVEVVKVLVSPTGAETVFLSETVTYGTDRERNL